MFDGNNFVIPNLHNFLYIFDKNKDITDSYKKKTGLIKREKKKIKYVCMSVYTGNDEKFEFNYLRAISFYSKFSIQQTLL